MSIPAIKRDAFFYLYLKLINFNHAKKILFPSFTFYNCHLL